MESYDAELSSILDITEIKTVEPFKGLFQLEAATIFRIEESIKNNGYDKTFPIIVWKNNGENICIDGHQRLQSLITIKIKDVPVSYVEFETEKEAVEYAIRIQRDRRNISDADIVRRIALLDEVKERGGDHGNQHQKKEAKASTDAFAGKSAKTTAKKAGTSQAKVEKVRAIKKKKPELIEKIESGEISISKAYNEIKDDTIEGITVISEGGETTPIDRSGRTTTNRISKKELRTEEFERMFKKLCEYITREKLNGWRTTSREYVKGCATRIKQLI